MKTEPNGIDRQAPGLFEPSQGMRMGRTVAGRTVWNRISGDPQGMFLSADGSDDESVCIDTDDPATVGCMLTQLERGIRAVSVVDRCFILPGDDERRFLVLVDAHGGDQVTATGPTRGAALVAAMRALKGNAVKSYKWKRKDAGAYFIRRAGNIIKTIECPRCGAAGDVYSDGGQSDRFLVVWTRDGWSWPDGNVMQDEIADSEYGCGFDHQEAIR